jgi:hypothetical protein
MDALLTFLCFSSYFCFVATLTVGFKYFKGKFKKHHLIGMLVVLSFILLTANFIAYMLKTYVWSGH